MKAAWIGVANGAPSNSGVTYNYLTPSLSASWSATENGSAAGDHKVTPLSEDVTVTKLTVWVNVDPGAAGNSRAFTIRDDGADTAASVTISGTATTASWSGSVDIAALSLVSMKTTPTSTPDTPGGIHWIIEYTTSGDYYLMLTGDDDQAGTADTYALPGTGHQGSQGTTVTLGNTSVMPSGATITKIVGKCGTAPGSGKSRTFVPRYAGVDAGFSAVVSNTNTVASASGSLAVDNTGAFTVKAASSGSPSSSCLSSCMTIEPDAEGDVALLYGSATALGTSTSTYYTWLHGDGAWTTAAESSRFARLPACTVTNLMAWLSNSAPPGSGKSRTFVLRSNSVDTAVSATISNTDTSNYSTNTATHADGDTLTYKRSATGSSPATGTGVRLAFSMIIEQPGPPEGEASGGYGWSSGATGRTQRNGTTSGTYTWSSAASGKATQSASAGTSSYTWAASATGYRNPKGTVNGTYAWETGSVGEAEYAGQVNTAYQWATGSVTGYTPDPAPTGTGQYGWAATGIGYSQRKATAAPTYTWAATVTGTRTPKSQGAPTYYTWASTAAGTRVAKGDTTGTYTWESGDVLGHQTGNGLALGTYHYTGIATGLFTPAQQTGVIGWYAEESGPSTLPATLPFVLG